MCRRQHEKEEQAGLDRALPGGGWRKAGIALKKTWLEAAMFLTGTLPDANTSPYPFSILAGTGGWRSVQAQGNLDKGFMVLQSE